MGVLVARASGRSFSAFPQERLTDATDAGLAGAAAGVHGVLGGDVWGGIVTQLTSTLVVGLALASRASAIIPAVSFQSQVQLSGRFLFCRDGFETTR